LQDCDSPQIGVSIHIPSIDLHSFINGNDFDVLFLSLQEIREFGIRTQFSSFDSWQLCTRELLNHSIDFSPRMDARNPFFRVSGDFSVDINEVSLIRYSGHVRKVRISSGFESISAGCFSESRSIAPDADAGFRVSVNQHLR
jgi:hypothetical protein